MAPIFIKGKDSPAGSVFSYNDFWKRYEAAKFAAFIYVPNVTDSDFLFAYQNPIVTSFDLFYICVAYLCQISITITCYMDICILGLYAS